MQGLNLIGLRRKKYENKLIIGLDKADREQYEYAYSFFKEFEFLNFIQLRWRD